MTPLLHVSEWFDADWYLQQYPDIAAGGMDPSYHYLHHGITEGKRPGPHMDADFLPGFEDQLSLLRNSCWFDADWYLQQNLDIANTGIDPAIHYLQHGIAEGRLPSASFLKSEPTAPLDYRLALLKDSEWFDSDWYLQQYPDVAFAGFDAADHYLNFGAAESRQPGPLFDEGYYLSQLNEPLNQPSGLLHYLVEGKLADLKPVRDWTNVPWWWHLTLPVAPPLNLPSLQLLKEQPLPVVVIPVFNAVDSLSDCLASLKQYRQGIAKVILINDASTDPAITDLLDQYKQDSFFNCYHNEHNLGFSGSVNRGFNLAPDADIILLNSDTKVTRGFAQRLRIIAYSSANVATVTPLSNNAGVFSVPSPGANKVPAQFGLTRFALAITQAAVSAPISVPTGHGFCMFIRRAALNEAGLFDAMAFPRGYGEENDFCRRSAALGWQHLIDPRTYIFHQGSASFTTDKPALIAAGHTILTQRYPDYPALVSESFGSDSISRLRQQITTLTRMPLRNAQQIKPRVLYVISTLMGGTPLTNQDLMQALANEYECFVFHCDSERLVLKHFINRVYTEIAEHKLLTPIHALPHTSDEYDQVVASWLIEWSIDLVHVRHLAWHSLGLVSIVKALGIPLIISFHDFYTLCPSVKLLDNNQQYCAAQCTQGSGTCAHELWPKDAFSNLKHDQIHQWQQLFSQTLQACDAFVTTIQPAKELFLARYPALAEKPFKVIAHGRDFDHFGHLAVRPEQGEKLRLLCPGNIGEAKGLGLIQQLAFLRQDIEIHILGIITSELLLPDNVVIHGPYIREQFFTRVAEIKPHCGAILSIWPETWCHTLTEMWAAGIPVIGIDIGAVGERIRHDQAGWLVQDNTLEALEATINRVRLPSEWENKYQAVVDWQSSQDEAQTCQGMAKEYSLLYRSLIGHI
ncbi:MAG: hypothetical protein K0Q78_1642 [Cellvibrio sp.]|jgi:GT2 family glycosyltransferase/glycosyltransferase involved in cell wall biosynthesis|nr:hypothetical protein [Cellvibrio sp.]